MTKIKLLKKTEADKKIHSKNAIGMSVSLGFLIMMTAFSIGAYNSWIEGYMNERQVEIEQRKLNMPVVERILSDDLFLKNSMDKNLQVNKVTINDVDCLGNFSLKVGISEFDITSCLAGLPKDSYEIVVYTSLGLHSEYFYHKGDTEVVSFYGDPYLIGDGDPLFDEETEKWIYPACYELQRISEDLDGDYVLVKDINCEDTSSWNDGAGFIPIGNWTDKFTGSLNGGEFDVYGLHIENDRKNTGLFGNLLNASITNIALDFDVILADDKALGGLAGVIENSVITNVHVVGAIGGNKKEAGGIAGTIIDSVVTRSSFNGQVFGDRKSVGGLFGIADNLTLSDSFAVGNLTGVRDYLGGLVGDLSDSNITNSYASTTIDMSGAAGGLVGRSSNSVVSNSYWDTDVSGYIISAGGGNGFNTTQMMTQSTFNLWDFALTWIIDEGNSYPSLR